MTVLDQKNFPIIKFFFYFVTANLGLDPDWIRIQQQAGSGFGFSKISGSGSGLIEYGSETLPTTHLVRKARKNMTPLGKATHRTISI
jgi:hypothetical protein